MPFLCRSINLLKIKRSNNKKFKNYKDYTKADYQQYIFGNFLIFLFTFFKINNGTNKTVLFIFVIEIFQKLDFLVYFTVKFIIIS